MLCHDKEKDETISFPENAVSKIEVGKPLSFGLSSTKVRKALSQGERLDENMLHPVTLQYILDHSLYSSSNPAAP